MLFTILPSSFFAQRPEQKPEIPVEQWKGKTAVLIGAHADDDELSHGTLALLQAHGNQRWHKSDHRAAAYLTADAARAAMWRLLFEGQITQEGLKEYMVPEYLLYNDYDHDDENITVDINDFVEKRVSAGAKYVSQFGPGWKSYKANLSEVELKDMKDLTRKKIRIRDGKAFEGFRYYRGLPDALGK